MYEIVTIDGKTYIDTEDVLDLLETAGHLISYSHPVDYHVAQQWWRDYTQFRKDLGFTDTHIREDLGLNDIRTDGDN